MTLWFVFALMTAAAIFTVLWPLSRGGRPQQEGSEAAVYKDQLREIDRDVAAGLIGASEAEAARVEYQLAAVGGGDRHGWTAGRGDCALPAAWLAPTRGFFVGTARAHARPDATARQSGGAGRATS